MKIITATISTLMQVALVSTGLCIESDSNTLLLLHFESNLNGAAGETPITAVGVSYETGMAGSAAYFPANNQALFPSSGNINATNGTLEFWIKPRWNGADGQPHAIAIFGGDGGLFFGKDGGNYWRSIGNRYGASGGQPEVGVGVNVSSEWTSNEWHHAAFTWSPTSLKIYVDGIIRDQAVLGYLPPIGSLDFQIGADGTSGGIDATIDELRISDRERTSAEVEQSFLSDLPVNGVSIEPATTNLLKTWWHMPSLILATPLGNRPLPASAAVWTSANTNIATVDPTGKVLARGSGATTLTATVKGHSATLTVNVSEPILPPSIDDINIALGSPATNALYEIPVVVINYIPTPDGTNVDNSILDGSSIAAFKNKLTLFNKRVKFMLEEGSRFRGYANPTARPSLGYRVVRIVTAYEAMPPGKSAGDGDYFPNYNQILERFEVGSLVTNQNVKEVWLWGYHTAGIVPVESDMSSPLTGDISNSYRDNSDLPIYDRTYVLYNYNSMRTQAEAVHNHGHQLEAILGYVNTRQDGNDDLFWNEFCGRNPDGSFQAGRCGNTHFPPNATADYDYENLNPVASDCQNWTPGQTGQLVLVNANTWGGVSYAWPDGISPSQQTESQYYIFWMQNMPGWQNGIRYGTNVMANWWEFTGDWDNAIKSNRGLHRLPNVSFLPSSLSRSNGVFRGILTGDAGFGCEIEASTNLVDWVTLTNITSFPGTWEINDTSSAPRKFYRPRLW